MPVTRPHRRYKCFRHRALEAINLDNVQSNGYSFQIEMTHKLWRQGMKVVEVPIVFTDRFQGRSKMSGHIVREAFIMVWKLWFQNKMRRRPIDVPLGEQIPPGKRPPPDKGPDDDNTSARALVVDKAGTDR